MTTLVIDLRDNGGGYLEKAVEVIDELLKDVKEIELQIPNLHILNRSSLIIDNVCIVGCTLWSRPLKMCHHSL